jgi:hypothetical protein
MNIQMPALDNERLRFRNRNLALQICLEGNGDIAYIAVDQNLVGGD